MAPLENPFSTSVVAQQLTDDPFLGQDKQELIFSGRFMLVDVHVLSNYGDIIYGQFCEVDFTQQQQSDPSLTPRYMDIYSQSLSCQEHRVSFPLREIAAACRTFDARESSRMHSVDPTVFILHQPKSGSSLLTNIMIASGQHVGESRVIADANALGSILSCETCLHHLKVQAVKDAMYLLGRTNRDNPVEKLYVSVPPSSTVGLPVIREAFPDTRWMYLYRDANVVVQKLMNSRVDRRVCSEKKRRNPGMALSEFVLSKGKDLTSLNDEQVCSAFLSTSMWMVQQELNRSPASGMLVNYDNDLISLKGIKRLMFYLDIPIDKVGSIKIQEQMNKHSSSGGGHAWSGETVETISDEVREATAEFVVNSE
jgi:hypothetical protein